MQITVVGRRGPGRGLGRGAIEAEYSYVLLKARLNVLVFLESLRVLAHHNTLSLFGRRHTILRVELD